MSAFRPLNILILEDNPVDADLLCDALAQADLEFTSRRAENEAEYIAQLSENIDLILADYQLPQFNALQALQLLQARKLDIPFIVVTGIVTEQAVVACMKQGAADYLLKDRLTGLGQAVVRALADKNVRQERRQTEEEVRRLKAFYGNIVQSVTEGIVTLNANEVITFLNPAAAAMLGSTPEESLGLGIFDTKPRISADQGTLFAAGVENHERGVVSHSEIEVVSKDGTRRTLFISSSPLFENNRFGGTLTVLTDITVRKLAEETLAKERNLLRTLVDNLPVRVYSKDVEGRFILKNQADALQMGAASTDEVVGKTDFDFYPLELAKQYDADDKTVIQSGQPLINREEPFIAADGSQGWMLTSKVPLRNSQGTVIGLVGIGRDITERKRDEEKLRKLNRALALLSGVNQAIVRIRPVSALFERVCCIAVDPGGLRMAWIGLLDPVTRRVNPVAYAGVTDDYLEKLDIIVGDERYGSRPMSIAIQTGEHVISNDIKHDPRMTPWREDALRLGYRALAAFPLIVAGTVVGAFGLYAAEPEFFDEEEVYLLDEMAGDISFAMEFAEQEAQRQRAEAELQRHVQFVEEMRLFLQTTLDAFPANTVVLDSNGTIINGNQAWIQFADENNARSPMHYVGTNYLTVCDTAAGPWSEEAVPTAVGIRTVIQGQKDDFYLEYPCHSPTEKRWFAIRVTPFPEPVPRRVLIAHFNITERKQAQVKLQAAHDILERRVVERTAQLEHAKQRVEAILNNSPVGIVLLSVDLRIQQVNPSFSRLFASQPDVYFDKSLFDLISKNNTQEILENFQEAGSKRLAKPIEIHAKRYDGTIFDAELSIGYVKDDGLVCTISDITDRKRAEEALHQALAMEKELGDLKTRFVSMASHEFRTPLASILAITETLSAYRHKLTDEQIEQRLTKVREQVDHLKDIMDDVLQLARLQSRRSEFNPVTFDLDSLYRSVIDGFQSDPSITHQILYSCDTSLRQVTLDKKLMRQILNNLLSNAIKYSPAGKMVEVSLTYSGDALVLKVRDEGIGIPQADLKHLFEPFHRAANVGTIAGTGLGLVITKESIERHGGTIRVESQTGIGTTFIVIMPVVVEGELHDDKNSDD